MTEREQSARLVVSNTYATCVAVATPQHFLLHRHWPEFAYASLRE